MKISEEFCGQGNGYSRSITLRNRLIPVGKTEKNLKNVKMLDGDFERAKAYAEVKNLIDDFHRSFIEDVLSNTTLDWGALYDQFDLFQSEKDKSKKAKHKKQLEVLQSVMRKDIVKKFKNDERYAKLFKKELLTDLLPSIIKDDDTGTITDKKAALDTFNDFATYFTGFHQNRENLYSEEAKATAISNRIVNENFPKFYANVKVFEYLQKNFPNIISDTEDSLKDFLNEKKLSEIFNKENFNAVLSQSGIDFYNTVIGGISGEAGKEKVQGLNEKINLASQQLPPEEKSKLRKKMTILYKQILSDKKTASFIPAGFENSAEVYNAVRLFKEQNFDKANPKISKAFSDFDYDLNEIFVSAKELTAFSLSIFGNWSILSRGLFLLEKDKSKKELSEKQSENIIKQIAKNDYSLFELQGAYERWAKENSVQIDKTVKNYFLLSELRTDETKKEKQSVKILEKIDEAYAAIDFEKQENLQAEKEAATPIKNFLDEVQSLYHYLKLVDYRGEEQKDSNFYSKLDEILSDLAEIIPLYNKVRNFVTKKPGEVKKVKLNFECSSFLNGWATDFGTKDAHIFIKDNKYYLGIIDKKLSEEDIDFLKKDGNDKHLIYDFQKPDNKNTPRLFIRSKGDSYAPAVSKYNLPIESVIDLYDKGAFKTENRDKNPKEYKEALSKLIDYFKLGFSRHDSYKNYKFCWKKTEDYNDIAEFYADTIKSCYQLKFENINFENLEQLADDGKLYLFQIYNKDFEEKATGKKNLHTLYWENLFSEENLLDVCLKLNGEAELFFRPKSENLKEIRHKKGSVLVNKTTVDGKSIPEEIYQEIYKFKNNINSPLSDEAQKWLDGGTVVYKEARFELVKDKHFTQDTYLFHCPITMNFKAPEITGRKFNEKVLNYLRENPDVKIIGLDRGERHLIYLSLINQRGEIELQKTLNLVEQVRNDKIVSVNYHEKLVQKEGDRDKARKNWQTIGNIKELKEGYLSAVVHEIAKLMVEHNAIVVMEDLNFYFKRGRFAVERQVYQKFENMLIEKLNYLVFKDKAATEPGGVLNAYQLTDKSANVSDVGKQCGWLFYVPAAYTSKIDPKTGFANLFITKGLTNVEKKKAFFERFDAIRYDKKEDCFIFSIDYSKLSDNADYKKKWDIYSRGERIVYSKKDDKTVTVNPTENLKSIFEKFGVQWSNEENFIDSLLSVQGEKQNATFFDKLLRSFTTILQMRNSIPNTEVDYLISPVKAEDGTFFDSR
ncbi:MAG: type V CRISPR-associated protein Cas12a/Cpf1, partial [Treponema sp.]